MFIPPYALNEDVKMKCVNNQTVAYGFRTWRCWFNERAVCRERQRRLCPRSEPACSRTVPFVSKCIGESLAKVAARCMAGQSL
jgi:carbamoyl-phosphate synthase large subunit